MTTDWRPGPIEGVRTGTFAAHPDDRGSFMELWRPSWFDGVPEMAAAAAMRQANLSRSKPRVLRGLHMHLRQADLWIVVEGRAFVGLVDVRGQLGEGGPVTSGSVETGPGDAIWIPEGVAHGFYAREALTLVYFVTNEFDGTDELGFAWNDPKAAVVWPDPAPILSLRDQTAPSLAELVSSLRRSEVVDPAR
jgi:dTDP-4-dehydrorhamnose 3,5-epimerase